MLGKFYGKSRIDNLKDFCANVGTKIIKNNLMKIGILSKDKNSPYVDEYCKYELENVHIINEIELKLMTVHAEIVLRECISQVEANKEIEKLTNIDCKYKIICMALTNFISYD
jgi:hypothetical protein